MKLTGITTEEVRALPEEELRRLFPLRFIRAQKYRHREDQLRCLGAGVLLHRYLGLKEEDLRYQEYGKPCVPGFPGDFSLSHSGDLIVLAVTGGGVVGVDVERIDRRHTDLAGRVLIPEEISWMDASSDESQRNRRFYQLWTLKESVMKAEGKGLSLPPESFSVLPAAEEKKRIASNILQHEYTGFSQERNGYLISCVGSEPFEEVTILKYDGCKNGGNGGYELCRLCFTNKSVFADAL